MSKQDKSADGRAEQVPGDIQEVADSELETVVGGADPWSTVTIQSF